jgi:tripartite-type tricarboxylate transporter receptor subunit TctC
MIGSTSRQFLAAILALGAFIGGTAHAGPYPDRPIRMMVGFEPGGTTTLIGRLVSQKLTDRLGQSVIMETHPGASGMIAAQLVAKAAPDGYTLLFTSSVHGTNLSLYPAIPYDTVKDFTSVGLAAQTPYVLVVHPSLPAHSLKELVAYLKANPGKVSFASPGSGTAQSLAAQLFKRTADVNIVSIPYKGSGNVLPDLLSGRVGMAFGSLAVEAPFIKVGKLRAIATTGAERSSIMPDIPTMVESGLPDFKVVGWFGVFGPAHLPPEIVTRLNTEINSIMKEPEMVKLLLTQGAEPMVGSPQAEQTLLLREISVWSKVIREAGIKGD